MPDEIAVKLGFGVTIVSDGVVEVGQALAGHQFSKRAHQLKRAGRIHAEVSARVGEKDGQISLAHEQGVEGDAAVVRMKQAKGNRPGAAAADRAADDVSAPPAVKNGADDFDFINCSKPLPCELTASLQILPLISRKRIGQQL